MDDFYTIYLDNILIFSETLEEHHRHIEIVLEHLIKAKLYIDIDKLEFYTQCVKYLGMIIMIEGIRMDLEKV